MRGRRALLWGSCAVSFLVLGTALAEKGVKPVLPSGCDLDEVAKWSESGWVCAPDIGSLDPSISCPAGWIPRSTGNSWECVEDPTGRVTNLEGYLDRWDHTFLTVDCSVGESVNAILSEKVGWRVGPVTIDINGFCDEDVNLRQDKVHFRSAAGSTDAGFGKLTVGARGTLIEDLRLARGLEVVSGSEVGAVNLVVDDPDWGNVSVGPSSSVQLQNPTLTNCQARCIELEGAGYVGVYGGELKGVSGHPGNCGVAVSNGGSIGLFGTNIRGFINAMEVGSGGSAYLDTVRIEDGVGACSDCGAIKVEGSVTLYQSTIRNNEHDGIVVQPGGQVSIKWGEITGNAAGVTARGGSVYVQEAEISGNHGPGIIARNGSSLMIVNLLIAENEGDGIRLGDVSTMVALGHTDLTANLRWGLYCAPSPAVAQYTLPSGSEVHAQYNFEGQISCPLSTE